MNNAWDVRRLLFGCSAVGMLVITARAEMTVVGNGHDPCPIVLSPDASAPEQKAAQQLAQYLKAISGVEFRVLTTAEPAPDRAIVVGPAEPMLVEALGRDGYLIQTVGGQLRIRSSSETGIAYGVYAFLEDVLGCRWWSYTEEDVPRLPAIVLKDVDIRVKAPFVMHRLMNLEAQSSTNDFALKARTTGQEYFTGGHTLYPLLTPYAKEHPEIYPMDKQGQRKPNNLHFCYLASGIAEALAEALAKQVEARKGNLRDFIYFAGMGDWYGGMCECQACTRLYEEETWTDPDGRAKPGYTATLLRMINRTAEILQAKYPGILVGTFAYMSLEAPPAKTVPRHNVVIWVPRLRHCTVHPAATCEVNRSFLRNVERWCELAPGRVSIWEYGANFKNFVFPFPCIHSMAENLKLYHKLGIRGVSVQGNYVSTGGDLAVLKNYVWRKVMWNPALDTDELIREFCAGYFGPAADPMLEYVTALEDTVQQPKLLHADEFSEPVYLTQEARQRLAGIREKAIAFTRDQEPYSRRVKEATVGLEALMLSSPSPLEERNGRLLPADRGEDAPSRAADVLSHIRNSSNNEWTSGKSYWVNFLARSGSPLVRLSQGPLRVMVAPLLSGQIRQISYEGRDILYVATEPTEKGYPMIGGSMITLGEPLMRIVGEPSPTRVEMIDDVEIPNWRFSSKGTVHVTIEVDAEGNILLTGLPTTGFKPKAATVSTTYPLKSEPQAPVIQVKTGDGQWQAVQMPPDQNELLLGAIAALRLSFPDKGLTFIDQYLSPPVDSAKLVWDKDKKRLTTTITTRPISATPKEKVALVRTMRVSLTGKESPG